MKALIFSLHIILFLSLAGSASASTFNLSPASGNVAIGENIAVKINLNTGGDAVNAVSVFLSYPSDKLDVAYVTAGSAFSIEAEKSFGGGVVKISRGNINPVTGSVTVATVGFKGKAEGTAAVAFIAGSAVPRAGDSSDSLNLSGSSGGTYAIVKGKPKPSESPAVIQTKEPVKAPVISDIEVSNITTKSATISWITDSLSDSNIEYGLEKGSYFLSASNGNFTTEHEITLEGPLLTSGAKFHFRVFSKDKLNNLSTSEDMSFELIGYKVVLKLVNTRGNPVGNAQVQIFPEEEIGVTDKNGEVSFENVTLGKHSVLIKSSNTEKIGEIEVTQTSDEQNFELNFDLLPKKEKPAKVLTDRIAAVVLIAGILGLILLAIYLLKRNQGKGRKDSTSNFPDFSGSKKLGEPVIFKF